MPQPDRHQTILVLAQVTGRVTVDDLVARLGVSAQTIRADLRELAETGQLERKHGGAVLPSGTCNLAYEERRRLYQTAKTAIGRAAAARVPNGAAVFLNIGTTTEAVARALTSHENLMVITNNLNVAQILGPTAQVVLTGGDLRATDGGLTGPQAAEIAARYVPDIAILGCSAISPIGDLLDFDTAEVAVTRAVLPSARHSIVVADPSKYQRSAPAKVSSLSRVDTSITHGTPLPATTNICSQSRTEIVLA